MRVTAFSILLLIGVAACRPAPHRVERVEVVGLTVADASLLGLSAAQIQADLARRVAADARFRMVPPGTFARDDAPVIRMTLDLAYARESPRPGREGPLGQVAADLTLRRKGPEGVRRTEVSGFGEARLSGESLEERQEALRRALDLALDDALVAARTQLDAEDRSDRALIQDLRSGNAHVRRAALDVLAARRNPAALPAILEQLRDGDPLEQRRALGILVEMRNVESVPSIIDMARGKDPEFVREIVYALGAIGGEEARAYLYTVSEGHDVAAIREAAKQALDELAQRIHGNPPALPAAATEARSGAR